MEGKASIHAMSIGFPYLPCDEVPWSNGMVQDFMPTSPMLCKYTNYIGGVAIADQL